MSQTAAGARSYEAGPREAGVVCPHCRRELVLRDFVAVCDECGTAHHDACWRSAPGCGSYGCAPANRSVFVAENKVLKITAADLDSATPAAVFVPSVVGPPGSAAFAGPPPLTPLGYSKLALSAFVVALLGIPLFGIITGPLAVILGCAALLGRRPRQRGVWLAGSAILLGIGDFVGWTVYFAQRGGLGGHAVVALDDFKFDAAALEGLPEHIGRAMKANVLIQSDGPWGGVLGKSIGSGVIVRVQDGSALIVTNRHVVDAKFAGNGGAGAADEAPVGGKLNVKFIGQPAMPGTVLWVAPHGIDLALVSTAAAKDVVAACWEQSAKPQIGGKVFAIGNPHGLGWTHTGGDVSQIRRQAAGPIDVKIIQTSAAINPGNSGGGLYDERGYLIGINTWTQDKRLAEGLGFAVAFQTLLDLAPGHFRLPTSQLPRKP